MGPSDPLSAMAAYGVTDAKSSNGTVSAAFTAPARPGAPSPCPFKIFVVKRPVAPPLCRTVNLRQSQRRSRALASSAYASECASVDADASISADASANGGRQHQRGRQRQR
ncbi:unnamed protein product [Closterium sp. NIES-53]